MLLTVGQWIVNVLLRSSNKNTEIMNKVDIVLTYKRKREIIIQHLPAYDYTYNIVFLFLIIEYTGIVCRGIIETPCTFVFLHWLL